MDIQSSGARVRRIDEVDGFHVETADGPIGVVVGTRFDHRGGWLLVRTSSWQGDRVRLLPASAVTSVDRRELRVYVDAPRTAILAAPAVHHADPALPDFLREVAHHYGVA